jgi:hypothetical protein
MVFDRHTPLRGASALRPKLPVSAEISNPADTETGGPVCIAGQGEAEELRRFS